MEVSISENFGSDKSIVEELIPRNVRFRDKDEDSNDGMKVDSPSAHPTSWKDMLVGPVVDDTFKGPKEKEAIVFMDGDIQKTVVNGVPSITFSYRIHQILFQGMGNTMILKLLGCNIGFSVLQNKIYSLWKPSAPLHMMDVITHFCPGP